MVLGKEWRWLQGDVFTPMKSDHRLDISGVVMPFSLALCKSTLAHMKAGAVLEICLGDHDTLKDLLIIVERSRDHVLAWERHDSCCYLWVRKSREDLQ